MGKANLYLQPLPFQIMKTQKFPSVASVRSTLFSKWQYLRRNFSRSEFEKKGEDFAGQDVRLQVWENGNWAIHVCSSDYDQDHRGFWGASCLCYDRQNLAELARDLIEQAKDDHAQRNL